MARRFSRRRRRFTWLFSNGTALEGREGIADFVATPFTLALDVDEQNDITHEILPLNPFDQPVEPEPTINVLGPTPQVTLADILGSEYVTERIVGNCWAVAANTAGPAAGQTNNVLVAVGIFVARADGTNVNRPIGPDPALAAGLDERSRSYNPLDAETQREPWMFRRCWMLSSRQNSVNINQVTAATSMPLQRTSFPITTAGYHGLWTGPFFDVKSKRRIRQDDRLWLVLSAQLVPPPAVAPAVPPSTVRVEATFDFRILGALRKARQTSTF